MQVDYFLFYYIQTDCFHKNPKSAAKNYVFNMDFSDLLRIIEVCLKNNTETFIRRN